MGVDERNIQVMDVKVIVENFPIPTYGTYTLTSSNYCVDAV